jgi:hypothetical protein
MQSRERGMFAGEDLERIARPEPEQMQYNYVMLDGEGTAQIKNRRIFRLTVFNMN